jgi:hypothetical protein
MNLPPATPEESAELQPIFQEFQEQAQAQAQEQAQEQAQAQAQVQSQLRRRMLIGITAYIGLMAFNQEAMRETINDVEMMFGEPQGSSGSVLQYAVSSVALVSMFLYTMLSR